MSYRISTLSNLPVVEGIELYIFVLGGIPWKDSLLAEVEDNFLRVAEELGANAAVVRGHNKARLGDDLAFHFYENSQNKPDSYPPRLDELVERAESGDGSILILGNHPERLGPNDLVLFADLGDLAKRFGDVSSFLSELCRFADTRDSSFLERFKEDAPDALDHALNVVELKPNFFGIGLNINAALTALRRAMSGQSK